jgi:hypothetical protein
VFTSGACTAGWLLVLAGGADISAAAALIELKGIAPGSAVASGISGPVVTLAVVARNPVGRNHSAGLDPIRDAPATDLGDRYSSGAVPGTMVGGVRDTLDGATWLAPYGGHRWALGPGPEARKSADKQPPAAHARAWILRRSQRASSGYATPGPRFIGGAAGLHPRPQCPAGLHHTADNARPTDPGAGRLTSRVDASLLCPISAPSGLAEAQFDVIGEVPVMPFAKRRLSAERPTAAICDMLLSGPITLLSPLFWR